MTSKPTIPETLSLIAANMPHYKPRELSTIVSRRAWPDCSRLFTELAQLGFVTESRTVMARASDGCRVEDLGTGQVHVSTAFLDRDFSTRQWEAVVDFITQPTDADIGTGAV